MPTEVFDTGGYGYGFYGHGFYSGTPAPENTDLDTDGSGVTGKKESQQWGECDRCGFSYPLSKLRLQQGDGGQVVVCTVVPCYDELSRDDMRPSEYPREAPLSFVDEEGPSA